MFRKIKATEAPRRKRASVSRFEVTAEWKQMRAALDKGLTPNEALEVILTPEDKKKYDIKNRRTVTRFIKKYLRAHGLKYALHSFNRELGDYFIVSNPVVLVKSKRS